jgi:hypothetical protein
MNTWERNPQTPDTEHDWVQWFADPTLFRDIRWDIHADGLMFSATPQKVRSHG